MGPAFYPACGFKAKHFGVAGWATFVNGPIPHGVIAVGVLVAGIKNFATFGAFFHQLPIFAFGAGHASGKWFGVLTIGVIVANFITRSPFRAIQIALEVQLETLL